MQTRFVTLCLIFVLSLLVLPVGAQQPATTLTVNDFSLTYDAALAGQVRVIAFPGDPADLQQPGGPMPPATILEFYPDLFAVDQMPSGSIYVFKTADFAAYPMYTTELEALNALAGLDSAGLAALSGINTDGSDALPYLPPQPAVQILRGQPRAIDTGAFSGIAYVTAYSQGVVPIHNALLRYTLQLVSADGQTYVSAMFNTASPLLSDDFPSDYNATGEQYLADLAAALDTLNATAPADFTPSLDALAALANTFAIEGMTASTADAQTSEAADPTLGGLAGTWTLTGWGDPAALTPVLEGTTVTVSFGVEGIGGDAGCNTYGGTFTYDNGALSVGPLAGTRRACEQPVMDQEFAFQNALMAATAYAFDGDTLTLSYEGGVLVFTRAE
jgi:heat shock protein HslJ